jgi:mono/diheme cytochrome c family protein
MRTVPIAVLCLVLAAGGGSDMEDQDRYEPYEPAGLFPDGSANQQPVPGTVYRGELADLAALEERPPMTRALLERGRERYSIFCSPCHGGAGDGEGVVVQRGFPHPPSFHSERLREAPTSHFMDVIRNGYGIMYSYAARVPPADRWAIVAYIRALQLSQHAAVADLPEAARQRLQEQTP